MKKIAIFQSDLRVGGIQKSIINLLSNLDGDEYDIDLFVFDEGEFFTQNFGENVHIVKLPRAPIVLKYCPYSVAYALYTPPIDLEKEYDVAVDFNSFWHECAIGAQKVNAKKRIMWLHSDISVKRQVEFRYRVNWALSRGKFRRFDELAAVSAGVRDSFYPCAPKKYSNMKISVIGNYIDTEEIYQKSLEKTDFYPSADKVNFISVGRLSYEKGYDILIDNFARAYKRRQDIHLYLVGDGDERERLEEQAKRLGVAENVTFLGNKPNPFPYEAACDVFVLTSRYEGQPLVLEEATAVGLPVIISKN
ncbi:MAG: glycosyltransferase, partial [Clostridia bacterium]|nr:glycosyltransferase [Clostridia bacterium]